MGRRLLGRLVAARRPPGYSTLGSMQRLDQVTYTFAKSSCYRCLSGGPVVDLDVHIEGEGCLALCVNCIGEAAQTAGLRVSKPAVK